MTLGTDILERSWGQKGSDPTVGEAGRDGNLFFPQKYVLHGFFSLVLPSRGRTPIVKPVLPEEAGNHEDSVCCLPSTNLAEFSPIFRIPFFGRAGGRSGRSGFSVHAAMHHRHPASNFLKMGRLRQRIEFPPLLERGGLWAGERFQFLALRNKCKVHTRAVGSLSLLGWQATVASRRRTVDGAGDTGQPRPYIFAKWTRSSFYYFSDAACYIMEGCFFVTGGQSLE